MDWENWGKNLHVMVVDIKTDALWDALQSHQVEAVVSWDPWVEDWLQKDPSLHLLAEREFRSAVALSVPWAMASPGRGAQLEALLLDALKIAASDRPYWDAKVSELSGWPVSVVAAVANQNAILHGESQSLGWTETDNAIINHAGQFSMRTRPVPGLPSGLSARELVFPQLLQGTFPGYRADVLATEAGPRH